MTAAYGAELADDLFSQSKSISHSQAAIPSEAAENQRASAQKRIEELIGPLIEAHLERIRSEPSLKVEPVSRSSPPLLYRVSSADSG